MSQTFFHEHLKLIASVTEMLNNLPSNNDFYVHVELREEGSHDVVGKWSDEIGPDAWYFEAS